MAIASPLQWTYSNNQVLIYGIHSTYVYHDYQFLKRNFQKMLDQMSPRIKAFELWKPGERVNIGNNFFIESEGGVAQKQLLEDRKEYKLYITVNYQSIAKKIFALLQYN